MSRRRLPMLIQYSTQDAIRTIVGGLPLDGRLFVQEPNAGHLDSGDLDLPYRIARMSDEQIVAARSVDGMVQAFKSRLDAQLQGNCGFSYPASCTSNILAVDEINARFSDRTRFGSRLSCAMARLAAMPHPAGGSYASHIHFYVSPSTTREIGTRRAWRTTYRNVQRALRLAGGVWPEMYSKRPHKADDWFTIPSRFRAYLGSSRRLFAIIRGGLPERGSRRLPRSCRRSARTPVTCQFDLLRATSAGRQIVRNGVGQYRIDPDQNEYARVIRSIYFPGEP